MDTLISYVVKINGAAVLQTISRVAAEKRAAQAERDGSDVQLIISCS